MPSIADTLAIEYLTLDYLEALDLMGRAVGQAIRDVWESMSAYDRAELAEFVERIQPIAQAGAVEGSELAGAYLAEMRKALPSPLDRVLDLPALDGPFLRYWHDLKEGYSWEQSIEAGGTQAEFIGTDSVGGGADQRMGTSGYDNVLAYQRVVSAGACEWCRVVATQLYKNAQTASFGHRNCHCRVVPVTEENAAAIRKINRSRLKGLRQSGAVQRATEARERNRERARLLRQ